jgi:acyl transferase domain-containing protein/SAM-dependent methyltransferase/acyl carrier protein
MSAAMTEAERNAKVQTARLLARMQAKLDAAEARISAPLAIVGMACRLPAGNDPESVWASLSGGRDSVRPVPATRWPADTITAPPWGGFLDGVDRFDAGFFGISPREAVAMDPQQRLVLEVGWEALEHAGIAPDRLEGSATGVFLGVCTADYARLSDGDDAADGYAATGGAPGVAAGRIAYTLGLSGPAMVVDTACSSSLVALHLAMQALRAGECDLALAGGVNLTLLPQGAATLQHLNMMSPRGRCSAFDAAADGFVRGEGCGVLVVKRLADAEASGDRILAILAGSAVNQDGRSAGLTAPNGRAQEAVIRAALARAGITPEAVDAIEAHGTGTALGDPIEMHALRAVFGGARPRPLHVGSIKTNIGHAEAAAGIAGVIKAVLMLRHQAIPPSLHFTRLNPHIDLAGTAITVPQAMVMAPLGHVGVSSFGFGGTNAHVVLRRAPAGAAGEVNPNPDAQLLISARTPEALKGLIARYAALLADGADFADVCHSAWAGRARLPWWVCVRSAAELSEAVPADTPHPVLPRQPGRRVDLPRTPFQRQRYWVEDPEHGPGRRMSNAGGRAWFQSVLSPEAALVADHVVHGQPLLPAADMIERMRAAALAEGLGAAVAEITFARPLVVETPCLLQVTAGADLGVFSRQDGAWVPHAQGVPVPAAPAGDPIDRNTLADACDRSIDAARFGLWLAEGGLVYGARYDCIAALWKGPGQVLARLRPAPFVAQLDAALRLAGALHYGDGQLEDRPMRLPASIARYERSVVDDAAELWAHARLVEEADAATIVDITLLDGVGRVVARVERLCLAAVGKAMESASRSCHILEWVEVPSVAAEVAGLLSDLPDLTALAATLDLAAVGYARRAVALVPEAEVVPRHRLLYRLLQGMARRPGEGAPPPGPEGGLLARCGAALPDVLRGLLDPSTLLFAEGEAAEIYRDASAYRCANAIMGALAAAALPPTGPLRVLEIGAGTGGTTGAVLARLDPARIEYWFTDIAPSLVEQARGRVGAQYFLRLDVEQPLAPQGVPESGFDLVIAANVLHATVDLDRVIGHALQALSPQGRLLLLETLPSHGPDAAGRAQGGWIDLVFGLTEGWWRFTDHARRPDHPLLSPAAWQALLGSHGLEVQEADAAGRLPGQAIFLARRRVAERVFVDPGGGAAARCGALLADIQSLSPEEKRLILRTKGAQGPATSDPAGAALWGMMRTLRLERPELEVICIDGDGVEAAMIAEPEMVCDAGRRLVPRLVNASAAIPVAQAAAIPNPDRAILVTGAFGGLGRFVAEWLVRRGATYLVLIGRQVPDKGLGWVEVLRAAGITITLLACDLADADARAALLDVLPPLGGLVHAAGLLDDATLAQATAAQFERVLAPKFEAAAWLDGAFPDLDFFILFSSAVGLFGQLGQASHVAASCALDALAISRRQRGQPAVSLAWGAWREIGAAVGRGDLARRLAAQGLGTVGSDLAEAALDAALAGEAAAITVLPIDRPMFLRSFADGRPPAAMRGWAVRETVRERGRETGRERGRGQAEPLPVMQPIPAVDLAELVTAQVAAVLGFQPGAIDRHANLFDIGLDSLMAVELRNRLQARLPGRSLSATLLFEHSSLSALIAHLGAGDAGRPAAQAPAVAHDSPIAIIGLGCRFPGGGEDGESFWQALAAGVDAIGAMPARSVGDERQRADVPQGGYLPDVAAFDPTFFGIAPREAVYMDPQHRLVLEVAWEALEHALIPPDGLVGSQTGVFLGMCNYDYAQLAAAGGQTDGYAGTGGAPSVAAGRIAYTLGLTGPAMVVDTACSSSLVTLHLAAQALRAGECTLALAGGVNLTLGLGTTDALQQLHMLSPRARCSAFDAAADGFVRGEGCGILVLKRQSDAERDGDRVLAIIGGSAINQDGRSAGLTAPSGQAQEMVIRAALTRAGIGPEAVDAVEAHGTGTALGDPIEMHALRAVFGGARASPLLVGSVKSNIGHAEAAAGVAGVIKSVLMLQHQAVPPSLHFNRLNPHIDLGDAAIVVPTALTPTPIGCVGVSSFGFSGTNAHVVLRRARADARQPEPNPDPQLLISARSPEALKALVRGYQSLLAAGLAAGTDFVDLCHSASIGRGRLPWWVCVGSASELDSAEPSDAPHPVLPPQPGRRVDLPRYPFQRRRYWVDAVPAKPVVDATAQANEHPLLGRPLRSALRQRQHEVRLTAERLPWLEDHRVGGRMIVPGSALVAMLRAAVPGEQAVELADIRLLRPLDAGLGPVVQTIADPQTRSLEILAAVGEATFETIATAVWQAVGPETPPPCLAEMQARCATPYDPGTLYAQFEAAGLSYGPTFRCLAQLTGGSGETVAALIPCPADQRSGAGPEVRLLDAAWQSLSAALPPESRDALMPMGVDRFLWHGGMPAWSLVRLTAPDAADVWLLDEAGGLVGATIGLHLGVVARTVAEDRPVIRSTVWHPIAAETIAPENAIDWIDCRHETDPVAACWRVLCAARSGVGRLGVLVQGAVDLPGGPVRLVQAALLGLVATLAIERPELHPIVLDTDGATPPSLPMTDPGPILAWRDGCLLAPQLEDWVPLPAPGPLPDAPFALAGGQGTLETLHWAPADRRGPAAGEVEIAVAATGLNFRDVMNLLGVYPGDAGAPGVECAGIVTARGADVSHLAIGDAVVAIAAGSLASHVVADACLACRIPAGGVADWRHWAGQPVALLTVALALGEVARLRAGQRVLIHAATGGVGLAAVAFARAAGATIVATAGSAEKRRYLAGLGVTEIYDSRSLDFARAPAVDVVLNSLTGAAIPAGLRLLRPGGIFIEIGKSEIWTVEQVREVCSDIRYEAVALDRLILDNPQQVGRMLQAGVAAVASGGAALPVTLWPMGGLGGALRHIQAGRHISKQVVARTLLRPDGCYVVSGGAGALGRHLLRWLVARGARHILVLGRRAMAEAKLDDVQIEHRSTDVSDATSVRAALAGVSQPIRGVFHLAGALHDATAERMTLADLAAAFAAKLSGADILDQETRGHSLDVFVLFGSFAGVAGSAGQANYAAANAALAGIVDARRRRGAPALLIDWGAWAGEGMASRRSGPALLPASALDAMDQALASAVGRVSILPEERRPLAAGPAAEPLVSRLAEVPSYARLDLVAACVESAIAKVLGFGDMTLDRARPLNELGLDSLMSVELRNLLAMEVGQPLPTTLIFDYPTPDALTTFVATTLGVLETVSLAAEPVGAAWADNGSPDDLDALDALDLLERKLAHAGY